MICKCDWVVCCGRASGRTDEYGFALVNSDHCVNDDPFVLASQVEQAFYVPDPT